MALLEKQRSILDFTLASLLRRKGKNGLVLAIHTLMVFLLASIMFFTGGIRREAATVLRDAPQLVVQRQIAGRHETLPLAYGETIRSIPGVAAVRGRLWGYYYDPVFGVTYTVQAPDPFFLAEGEVAVGRGVARSALAEVGNIMPFRTAHGDLFTLTVARVLPDESELVTSDLVLISPLSFRTLFGIAADRASDLIVEVPNPSDLPAVAAAISRLLPDTRPISRNEIMETYHALFNWRSAILLSLLGGAALTFLIMVWDKLTGLSAGDRREVGILKSIGWGAGDVLTMKLWEGLLISLTAFLSGVIFAYVHVFLAGFALFVPLLRGWSRLYPVFTIAPAVESGSLALLFFLTVIPYSAALLIPSWRISMASPDSIIGG